MMQQKLALILFFCLLIFRGLPGLAQDSTAVDRVIAFPDKLFSFLDKKASKVERGLSRQTEKYLVKLEKQEARLKKKLLKKDPALAKELFPEGLKEKYQQLRGLTTSRGYGVNYSGHLDSLTTALQFLGAGGAGASAPMQAALAQYQQLQGKLNMAERARSYLRQRQALLKEQFARLGMVKELKKFRQQVYYYQAQVRAYKELFDDPSKLEAKMLELVMQVPQFKEYFAKNSILGSLFPMPSGGGTGLAGLQTRASFNQAMAARYGSGGAAAQAMQQNLQAAQAQLAALKEKAAQYGSGSFGSGDDFDLPDFKPNGQKTKTFLQRLDVGTNVQSQKARQYFPVTTDLGISLGYKLNDKGIVGVGASGKVGWGSGWNNIAVSYQGVGLRSFMDYEIPSPFGGGKGFYVSGGFEMNYRHEILNLQQLNDASVWQRSGLVGLSRKLTIRSPFGGGEGKTIKGEVKLLWDFLSYGQVPRGQPILFRVGYSIK